MVLLVIGTISQKYIGLYLSQKIYFSSYIVWLGDTIPVPGGYTTLIVIFINLLAKILVEKWTKKKIGTIIIHFGSILLLVGGFITAEFGSEGNMVIAEGDKSNFVSDYHEREIAFIETSDSEANHVTAFGENWLKPGKTLENPSLPFKIYIERYCHNCWVVQRETPSTDPQSHGMLRMNDIQSLPPLPENERNRSGIIFRIKGADPLTDGRYGIIEMMPVTQTIKAGEKTFEISLRRKRTYLPFNVSLIDFKKTVYPGTEKARSYHSEVILTDGDLQWKSIISMNNPLRYKGYTFFQSSFFEEPEKETTILAVVHNNGKIFPYISSIIICIGLLIHLFVRIPLLSSPSKAERQGTIS